MEESKPKPMSYDALKSILKYTSFAKREQIHRRAPELRKTNALIPYQLKYVLFCPEHCAQIEHLLWRFGTRRPDSPSYGINDNKCLCHIDCDSVRWYASPLRLEKSPDDAFEELLKTFMKNGTIIKRLDLQCIPQHLCRPNPENSKLKVSSIILHNKKDLEKLSQFLDEKSLKAIDLYLTSKNVEPFLNFPLIKNCPRLIIINHCFAMFPYSKLHSFNNEFLEHRFDRFPIHDLQALVAEWKRSSRPIGTIFLTGVGNRNDIIELMNRLREHLGAKSSKLPASLGKSSNENCITMKMDNGNNTELVVLIGRKKDNEWPMQMEVMAAGTTILDG